VRLILNNYNEVSEEKVQHSWSQWNGRNSLIKRAYGSIVVEELCYKLQGCRFNIWWGDWILSLYLILPATLSPGVYSASNINGYQRKEEKMSLGILLYFQRHNKEAHTTLISGIWVYTYILQTLKQNWNKVWQSADLQYKCPSLFSYVKWFILGHSHWYHGYSYFKKCPHHELHFILQVNITISSSSSQLHWARILSKFIAHEVHLLLAWHTCEHEDPLIIWERLIFFIRSKEFRWCELKLISLLKQSIWSAWVC
jgi:hypothetical protein